MKTILHPKLLLSILFLFNINAYSQTAFHSLSELWAYADKKNIQVQASEINKSIAKTTVKQAYGTLSPSINLNGNLTDNVKIAPTLIPSNLLDPNAVEGDFTEVVFGRRYNYNASISAQIDIFNMKDWFSIKAAKINEEIMNVEGIISKKETYSQIANNYYSFLLLVDAEKLAVENVNTSTEIYKLAKQRLDEGVINQIVVNTTEINKEKAEKDFNNIVKSKILQNNNLKLILNTTDSISISDETKLESTLKTDIILLDDPSVKQAYLQLELAKNEWKSSKSEMLPTVSAVYQVNYQIATDEFLKFENKNSAPQQYWGLKLAMPIFSGNNKRFQTQKNELEYKLSQNKLDYSKKQSQINNENLIVSYSTSFQALEKSKKILELYKSNDIHAERRLKEGVISLEERLKSYTELISYQNEYLQTISDYFIQEYNIQINHIKF